MSHTGSDHLDPTQPDRPAPDVDPTWADDPPSTVRPLPQADLRSKAPLTERPSGRTSIIEPVGHADPLLVAPTTERTTVLRGSSTEHVAQDPARAAHTDERTSVLRVPTFSFLAPILGWILAWGAIVIATTILQRANASTGFGLGIATGKQPNNGFWAGLRLLVVTGGAFLLGGYTAARLARAHGTLHGILIWVVAMLATAADTVVETIRSGVVGVIRLIPGVPYWAGSDLSGRGDAILVFAIFSGAALIGALIGGLLGQTANRVDRTDNAVLIKN